MEGWYDFTSNCTRVVCLPRFALALLAVWPNVPPMRFSPTLLLAVATACTHSVVRAEDPAKVDPSQQVNALNPAPDTTKVVEHVDLKHADNLQGQRVTLPGTIQEPMAPINGTRAPIDVTETVPKNIVPRKESAISTTPLPRKESNWNGQTGPDQLQPENHLFSGAKTVADKYQQRLTDANLANARVNPDLQKTTSFGALNRFIFHRNSPGSEGGSALVTAAGGGAASAPQVSIPAAVPPPSSVGSGGSFEVLGVINAPGSAGPPR